MAAINIAFEAPDIGASQCPSKGRPIDLVHLARQTMGDKELEAEVLKLFARQARTALDTLAQADADGRKEIAHRLKGSARGVGAFAVAKAAEKLETDPTDTASLAGLAAAVTEAKNFICGLSR